MNDAMKLDLHSMKLKAIDVEKRLEAQRKQRKEHLFKACQSVEETIHLNKVYLNKDLFQFRKNDKLLIGFFITYTLTFSDKIIFCSVSGEASFKQD